MATPADVEVVWGKLVEGRGTWGRGAGIERWQAAAVIVLILFMPQLHSWFPQLPGDGSILVFMTLALALMLIFWWHRRQRVCGLPGEVQLRTSPHGFAIVRGVGKAKWRPWKREWHAVSGSRLYDDDLVLETGHDGMAISRNVFRFRLADGQGSPSRVAERMNAFIAKSRVLVQRRVTPDAEAVEAPFGRG